MPSWPPHPLSCCWRPRRLRVGARRGGSRRARGEDAGGRLGLWPCRRRYGRRRLVGARNGNAEENRHDRKISHWRTPWLVRSSACLLVSLRSVNLCSCSGQRLVEQINAIAKADGITRSGATRKAIEAGLRKLQRKAPAQRAPKVRP